MTLRVLALGTGVCSDLAMTRTPRHPPGFLVDLDGFLLLFDCSEGIRCRLQQAGFDPAAVAHVALSHGHPDHAALPQFIQARYCRLAFGAPHPLADKLQVYLPAALARTFPAVWDWHQPEHNGRYWERFTPSFVPLDNGDRHNLAPGVTLISYDVYHGHGLHPSVGFRLETPQGVVAYTGDSGVCDTLGRIAEGADLLISDCSMPIGQEYVGGYGHMGPRQGGELARAAAAKTLWLTHYFDVDPHDAMANEAHATGFQGVTRVALDGDLWQMGP
jgi:ribonuclease BN (tRNA processing enzyme)